MMDELRRKIKQSREAGFSDDEIFPYIERLYPEKVKASRAAGFDKAQIVGFLAGGESVPAGQEIDDQTGAGWRERFAIGSATSDADKLARTRAFYGDSARQEKDGRISFHNPETGRRTYVNPSGFDMGDIFGGGRDVVSMVAGIPAAIAGTVGGGGVNLVTGALAGSAGGAAAGQGVDALAAYMARQAAEERGNPSPAMQSPAEALKEFGAETAFGTAGGAVMGGAGKLAAKAFNPMKREIVDAFKSAGLRIPSVGTATGTRGGALYDNALASAFGSSGTMERARTAAGRELGDFLAAEADRLAGGRAVPGSAVELGDFLKDAAVKSRSAWRREAEKKYGEFFAKYGETPASLGNVKEAIEASLSGLKGKSREAAESRLRAYLAAELQDESAGLLTVTALRNARTYLGELLKDKSVLSSSGVSQAQIKRLREALTADIKASLPDSNARAMLEGVDAWYQPQKAMRDYVDKALLNVAESGRIGEKLLDPKLSREVVDALRETLGADDFNILRGSLLKQMGRPLASEGLEEGVASSARVAKALNSGGKGGMSKETLAALGFSPEKLQQLKVLTDALSKSARNANTSKTAEASAWLDVLKSPVRWGQAALSGGSFLTGDPTGAILPGAIPWALSKANTSPRVIEYLARPQSGASRFTFGEAFPFAGRELLRPLPGLLDILAEEPKAKK